MSPADRPPDLPDPATFAPALMHAHAAEAAQLLKALGNEQRLHILCNLLDSPLSVGELNQRLNLSQSALSQHLALLREMGFVETRREAQTIHYSLPEGPVEVASNPHWANQRCSPRTLTRYCVGSPLSGGNDAI